ncbi:MAG: Sua5/YciO/YrdC/YwlC family protein [Acidobacteriota bacterium]
MSAGAMRGNEVVRWTWGEPVDPLRRLLAAGGVLAIPTESSYGLAADPRSERGVAAIFAIKGREPRKPLPVVAADVEQVLALGIDANCGSLQAVAPLWPAPLTVLLPIAEPLAAAAGGATLAVRIPAHRRLRLLLGELGLALTATSANRSGDPPILEPRALEPLLERSAIIVDDGSLSGGPPSTLVDWPDGEMQILRQGAYRHDLLAAQLSDCPPVKETDRAAFGAPR